MKYVELSNGVRVPALAFGTDKLREKDGIEDIVYNAIKIGYRHIDTAEIYHNEAPIGRAIRRCIEEGIVKREDLFITTKAPFSRPGFEETLQGFQESCQKLGVDYIDLYLIHHPFRRDVNGRLKYVPTWRAMEKLYIEGKCRAIGVSNFEQNYMSTIMVEAEIIPHVNQLEVHPQHQNRLTIEFCKSQGIQIMSWGALNQGRIFGEEVIKEVALKYNKTVSQIAINWNISKGYIPVVRSSKLQRIEENFKVFDFEIQKEDMSFIDELDGGEYSHWHTDIDEFPIGLWQAKEFFQIMEDKLWYRPQIFTQEFKLFGFIPFLKKKQYKWNKFKIFLFGIPILKITKELSITKNKQNNTKRN